MVIKFDCLSTDDLSDKVMDFIKESEDIINTDTVCRKNFDEYVDKKGKKHYTVEVHYDYRK